MTVDDWSNVERDCRHSGAVSFGMTLVTGCHALIDSGDFRHAYLEAYSALEVALHEFFHRKVSNLSNIMYQFMQMSMKTKVTTVSAFFDEMLPDKINACIEGIDVRNKVAHEGLYEENDAEASTQLNAMLTLCRLLLENKPVKLPSQYLGEMTATTWRYWSVLERSDLNSCRVTRFLHTLRWNGQCYVRGV